MDGERPRPSGLTGARLIGIVLGLLVLLVITLGLVEWINRGAGDGAPAESDAAIHPSSAAGQPGDTGVRVHG